MLNGKIQALRPEKGFGFIRPADDGQDVFFHRSAVNLPFDSLIEGQIVAYELDAESERARAKRVEVTGDGASGGRDHNRESRDSGSRDSGSRDSGRRDSGSRDSGSRSRGGTMRPPESECSHGFITKLHRAEPHGFISADAGGTEIRFEALAVTGEKRFRDLVIGDYVEFAVRRETADTKSPEAYYVREIERKHFFPQTQLSRHPNSKRKKPSWR